MWKLNLSKKGNTTVIGTIITIVLLFVLFLIITMFAKTQANITSTVADTLSSGITNETYPSASHVTNFYLNKNVNLTYFKTISGVLVTNSTGGYLIGSGNYSVDGNRGFVTSTNDTTEGLADWNISYTYTEYDDVGAGKISIQSVKGMSDAAADNATSVYLIAVVIMLIVFVMMIVVVVQRMRG